MFFGAQQNYGAREFAYCKAVNSRPQTTARGGVVLNLVSRSGLNEKPSMNCEHDTH